MNKSMSCEKKKGGSLWCIIGGMLAGAAVSLIGVAMMQNNKKTLQKKADKVADALGDLVDSAKDMFQ